MTYILPDEMRLGVNLLFMVPGEVGGSEPLLINLVRHVADLGVETTVFGVKGFSAAFPEVSSRCDVVEAAWGSGAQALRIVAEHSWIQAQAKRRRLDVVHHGVGTTPFIKTGPTVVTIHDIQFHHYPENFSSAKLFWLKANVPHSLKSCHHITVPSEWVRDDLASRLGADLRKVSVVPFGSEGLFGDPAPDVPDVRTGFGLDRPFFFFPGRTYRHKNHEALIRAFAPLAGEADLVFTGPRWGRDQEVMALAARMGVSGQVRHLGQVSRPELAGLYSNAVCLTYPTRFEGFGAPALEAMATGCPVIASNVTAVPEVVGDAGTLLDPDDTDGWTAAMTEVMSDERKRNDMKERGLARALTFRWETSAKRQLLAYEEAIAWKG